MPAISIWRDAALKLFLAATSLAPAYGGPAHSVSRLALALAASGADVGLWTPDQTVRTTPLLPAATVIKRLAGSLEQALAAFGSPDIFHDNGIWLAHNHRVSRLATGSRIPRIVSTRGMLEPWAMRHKHLKKQIAWHLYQRSDLRCAQGLHATSAQEAENLKRLGLRVSVCVIANGVDIPELDPERSPRLNTGSRTALFLGRIYPVKGLQMLIEAWDQVRPTGWRLRIAGPDEAGHRAKIEAMVASAGLGNVVSFDRSLDDEAKRAAFYDSDLLVLPSHSESFGIVVAEALAHGVPALTTTATPWRALPKRGCGWCVAPSRAGIALGLAEATARESAVLRMMGIKGRAWMAADFGWEGVANQFIAAYTQLVTAGRPPS